MKVCVGGAGAIGGYMAVHIANAGHEVSVIARGPHLAAIKDKGLRLIAAATEFVAGSTRCPACNPSVSACVELTDIDLASLDQQYRVECGTPNVSDATIRIRS